MSVRVRFASSPRGRLHLGNVRTALLNWLFAQRHAGKMVLRFDDADLPRSGERYAESIREDLRWLGLTWQEEHRQADRKASHLEAFARLKAAGRVYPCTESDGELREWRSRTPQAVYRRGTFPEGSAPPYWRLDLGSGRIRFDDVVEGPQSVELGGQSDPVLLRGDGSVAFQFASIIDDIDFQISHVIRGADNMTDTVAQISMARALGSEPPVFAHLPLMLDESGQVLSKGTFSITVRNLREHGIHPMAINLLLASLGTGREPDPADDLESLAARFDLASFERARQRVDIDELWLLTAGLKRRSAFEAAVAKLKLPTHGPIAPEQLLEVKRLAQLHDADGADHLFQRPITPNLVDPTYCRMAADLLPEPFDFDVWIEALKLATGRRGRELFHPLRLALTASERGPELKLLLAVLPRATVLRRLRGESV